MLSCSFCYRSECLRKYIFFVAISENLVKIFVIFTSWTFEKKKHSELLQTFFYFKMDSICYLTLVPLSISFTYIFFQELELNNLVFICFFASVYNFAFLDFVYSRKGFFVSFLTFSRTHIIKTQ